MVVGTLEALTEKTATIDGLMWGVPAEVVPILKEIAIGTKIVYGTLDGAVKFVSLYKDAPPKKSTSAPKRERTPFKEIPNPFHDQEPIKAKEIHHAILQTAAMIVTTAATAAPDKTLSRDDLIRDLTIKTLQTAEYLDAYVVCQTEIV